MIGCELLARHVIPNEIRGVYKCRQNLQQTTQVHGLLLCLYFQIMACFQQTFLVYFLALLFVSTIDAAHLRRSASMSKDTGETCIL